MNVIVANKNEGLLNSLDVDIIKSMNGEYDVAIKNYNNISNIQKLSMNFDIEKIIFLLNNDQIHDNIFLSKLISMGIYNFANTKETLLYLYEHPNTYKDVAHIHQLNASTVNSEPKEERKNKFFRNDNDKKSTIETYKNAQVIGFKNMTTGAGATTLIYMLKKYLSEKSYVVALEVNKNDFGFFNEKDMYSVNQNNLSAAIEKFSNASYILVDINNGNEGICDEMIYLIEPSTIKLNKMMLINKDVFEKIYGKKIILNKSLLEPKDVTDFEYESHSKILYNMPPLNDRDMNEEIFKEFIEKLDI